MPKYTFTFKKDDMFVEFTTTDRDIVERQFQIWVTCASVYSYKKGQQTETEEKKTLDFSQLIKEEVSKPSFDLEEDKKKENLNPTDNQPEISPTQNFEQKEEDKTEEKPQINEELKPAEEVQIKEEPIETETIETAEAAVEEITEPKPEEVSVFEEDLLNIDKEIIEKEAEIEQEKISEAEPSSNEPLEEILNQNPESEVEVNNEAIIEEQIIEETKESQVVDYYQEDSQAGEIKEALDELYSEPKKFEENETPQNQEVFDKASDLLRTINSIQNPEPEVEVEPETPDFEKVLEQSMEKPTFEPQRTKDERFLKILTSKNTSEKLDYLIITAYYLSEFENLERFSLKRINVKLMYNISEAIDHAALQEALDNDFIELVPDLTGVSDVSEYKLTERGEAFFDIIG